MNRVARIKIPAKKFSYSLINEIDKNYLPKNSLTSLLTPGNHIDQTTGAVSHDYVLNVISSQFVETPEYYPVPEIKIGLAQLVSGDYYVTTFDMSSALENSTNNRHSCTFDKNYIGLVETYKYCTCGKKNIDLVSNLV